MRTIRVGTGLRPAQVLRRLPRALRLLLATLREIFDENAYARFLERSGLTPSPSSFAAFQREHAAAKVRHPKCC